MTLNEISRLIRDERKKQGMTQQELADRAQSTKYTICQFENGKQNITLDIYFRICDALNLNPKPHNKDWSDKVEAIIFIAKDMD